MSKFAQGLAATGVALFIAGTPLLYHRYRLTTSKRLREVEPGRFYRCGQMTAAGFVETLVQRKIRTVINVQNEFPDPDLRRGFLDGRNPGLLAQAIQPTFAQGFAEGAAFFVW